MNDTSRREFLKKCFAFGGIAAIYGLGVGAVRDAHGWGILPSLVGGAAEAPAITTGTWDDVASAARTVFAALDENFGFQFTAPGNYSVSSVKVNFDSLAVASALTAYLYTNNAGSPGVQVGDASTSDTPAATGPFILYWASKPPITSGTIYWIVISRAVNFTTSTLNTVVNNASFGSGRHTTITSITDNLPGTEDWKCLITLE